jgi:LPXTG-motif cell wall-anchored protein
MNGDPITGAPCEAGDYTASITVEDATAYVDFTLSAPAPETAQVTAQLDLVSLDDNGAPVEGFAGGDIEPLGLDRQYPINSNAPITNELPAGEYRLVLMMLPAGWEWPEDRLFTVHPDGTLTSDEMNIELRNGVWHFEAGAERRRLQIVFMNGDEVFRTTQPPYGIPFNFYGMPIPTAPAGKMWGGWYTAEGVRLNPGDVMYTDLTVYARWTDIPPRTGDNTPVALLVTLMAMSLCGAALLMRRRKVNN